MTRVGQLDLLASAKSSWAQSGAVLSEGESQLITEGIRSSSRRFIIRLLCSGMAQLIGAILLVFGCAFGSYCPRLDAQVAPAASRPLDLQIGVAFDLGSSDYAAPMLRGFGFYTTLDFRRHFGIEGEFHQLDDPNSTQNIYERTYEVGPRFVLHYGPLAPYAKFMIGRGVFNFPPSPSNPAAGAVANLAYNIWAGGFGADYRLRPSIKVRGDYEFQRWAGFPPNGLSPRVLTLGVAYHFH